MPVGNGEKLKSAASIICMIEIICIVITGILAGVLIRGIVGIVCAAVVIGMGCLIAWAMMLLLVCIGEISENSTKQTTLLQLIFDKSFVAQPTAAVKDNVIHSERVEAAGAPVDNEPVLNTASFESRSDNLLECPVCHKTQLANRSKCFSCGCIFTYKNET